MVGGRINIKDLKNPSREEKITPVHQIWLLDILLGSNHCYRNLGVRDIFGYFFSYFSFVQLPIL